MMPTPRLYFPMSTTRNCWSVLGGSFFSRTSLICAAVISIASFGGVCVCATAFKGDKQKSSASDEIDFSIFPPPYRDFRNVEAQRFFCPQLDREAAGFFERASDLQQAAFGEVRS